MCQAGWAGITFSGPGPPAWQRAWRYDTLSLPRPYFAGVAKHMIMDSRHFILPRQVYVPKMRNPEMSTALPDSIGLRFLNQQSV